MDQNYKESGKYNQIDLSDEEFDNLFLNQRNDHAPEKKFRFNQTFQLSSSKKQEKSQSNQSQQQKNLHMNDSSANLSPPGKRYGRALEFQPHDFYENYVKKVEMEEQIRKNTQSSLSIRDDQQTNNSQNQNQNQSQINDKQQKVIKFQGKIFKSGANLERKRVPQIQPQKHVFKKMATQQIKYLKEKQSQTQKLKKQNIQWLNNGESQNQQNQRKQTNRDQLICFNCGGPHYLSQCTEQDPQSNPNLVLKCLNCKKYGHNTKNCEQEWRCIICQSTSHLARDCPLNQPMKNQQKQKNTQYQNQKDKIQCYSCHGYGHMRKDCPNNKRLYNSQRSNTYQNTCFNCKKTGHYANQCREPIKCHKCGLPGHIARDCDKTSHSNSLPNQRNLRSKEVSSENFKNFNARRR